MSSGIGEAGKPPLLGTQKKRPTGGGKSAERGRSRSPARPPAPRPAWDDSTRDLTAYRLTPQEQRQKKQLLQNYTPSRVATAPPPIIVGGTASPRRPSVSPSSSSAPTSPGPTGASSNGSGWPSTAPRGGRRPSAAATSPSSSTTRPDSGASSVTATATTPNVHRRRPSAGKEMDADVAAFERARGRPPSSGLRRSSSTSAGTTSTPALVNASHFRGTVDPYLVPSRKALLGLRRALLYAKLAVNGDTAEMRASTVSGAVGDSSMDDIGADDVVDLASTTVVGLARHVHLLERQLNVEADMRRRLETQVQMLATRVEELGSSSSPPSLSNDRGIDYGGADPTSTSSSGGALADRVAALERGHRAWVMAENARDLGSVFAALGVE
ncbi:hypothetical protein BC828DRAFT_298978 [Blastocladiella britannica]|nr:hypothetical protein BC828DRAFT_298978 [Blastocladiella britannica]